MDKQNYASDLEKFTQNIYTSLDSDAPNLSVKRKAEEITPNPYEDANKELRELYFLRRQKQESDYSTAEPNSEKTLIDLSNRIKAPTENILAPKKETKTNFEEIKETKKDEIQKKQGDPVIINSQVAAGQIPVHNKDPIMWINKLRIYPPDCLLDHMVTFRQMLFEDLLKNNPKDPNPPRTLQAAFMTTFGYSASLIENLLKGGVKLVLADEWSDIKEPRIEKNYQSYPNFTLIRSPKDPGRKFTGAFHPKIWLLKFPKFLRIVISSGNLTVDDWTTWSNCLWFKDCPKISTLSIIPEKKAVPEGSFDFDGDFTDNLKSFVQSLMPYKTQKYKDLLDINIDDYLIRDIDIVLIASVPGRHADGDLEKYGHRRVASVLKKIGFVAPAATKAKRHILTYQTSSVGNLDEKFLKEILSSFLPNYMTVEELVADKKPKGKRAAGVNLGQDPASNRVRVIFPSKEYVENSIEGPDCSGCLILNPDMYQKDAFCKNIFHHFQGTEDYAFHEGIIPHLKIFIVADESGEIDDDSYIYFGSHNFSPSAWGRYEKDCTQISISNTELGVLFPPKKDSRAKKAEIIRNLPFKFPPEKYSEKHVPWMFQAHYKAEGY